MGANTSVTLKNARGGGGTAIMTHVAAQSTAAAATAGTEIAGGSPAYARKPLTWAAWAAGASSASATWDIPSGATVASAAFYNAVMAGTFLDSASLTSQVFSSQGQYTVNVTDTQS